MRSKIQNSESFFSRYWHIIVIIALGFLVYSNTFQSSFHLDDFPSITNNISIRHLSHWGDIWAFWPSRFITYLSIAMNYHFSRLDVFSYHLFNLTVHLGSALLVRKLTLVTFLTPAMKDKKIAAQAGTISLFAGLLFVAHPLQTQAVTYIIQRAALLATFFYLACLLSYIQSRRLEKKGKQKFNRRLLYCVSLASAVFAMLCKEMAITLPLIILFYEISFLKEERPLPWKKIAPFLVLLCLIPLVMAWTHSVDISQMRRVVEPGHGISSKEYLYTQFRVVTTYLRLLFIPIHQNLDYDYPLVKCIVSLPVLASLGLLALILQAAVKLFSRHRLISFSIFWFFLTLLPESSILPIKDVIFEHRLYLPMVGFSIFMVVGTFSFLKNQTKAAAGMLLLLTLSYSFLAYRRNSVWKDEWTLWDNTVQRSPHKARPYNNRGFASGMKGEYDRAILDYQEAVKLEPSYDEAYNNLGFAYYMKKDYDKALSNCDKAILISPANAEAYNNRGLIHQNRDEPDQAMSDYDQAIALKPSYAVAHNNRALTYQYLSQFDEALADFSKAIKIDPEYADVYNNRGNAYQRGGNIESAIADYGKAIELNPKNSAVLRNRGITFGTAGRLEEALSDFNQAIEIDPNDAEAYDNRGLVFYMKGSVEEAILDFSKAIALDPQHATAYNHRDVAYSSKKDLEKSISVS